MRLLSFSADNRESFGIVSGEGVVDLSGRVPGGVTSLRDLLAWDPDLARTADLASRAGPDHALADITYLRPVPFPEKILCVGVNYADRSEEYGDAAPRPAYPSLFFRTPGSLVGHGAPLVRPVESEQLDYEGEIALVIGRGGRRIPAEIAERHIAGLTCMNDGTVRDWLRHGKFNVTQGKNFERSGAIGPWIATPDETGSFDDLTVTTTVNGEMRQHESTRRLLFPFRALLAYISTFTELASGDVIATGTPTGAGARLDPPRFLRAGDRVEVAVTGVGVLANAVIEERP